jgi:hypothetical protein
MLEKLTEEKVEEFEVKVAQQLAAFLFADFLSALSPVGTKLAPLHEPNRL